ncbi:hypothetical protein E2C01_019016 [Portunus trituberculatus]|uniref:Uncharacterized protein n=1 Tax=Portunus trituberculatus TaxID=210409 RepID=A0A5B7DW36_PORTR|nr:hypothetical protein [Portunus trituberculatus]
MVTREQKYSAIKVQITDSMTSTGKYKDHRAGEVHGVNLPCRPSIHPSSVHPPQHHAASATQALSRRCLADHTLVFTHTTTPHASHTASIPHTSHSTTLTPHASRFTHG